MASTFRRHLLRTDAGCGQVDAGIVGNDHRRLLAVADDYASPRRRAREKPDTHARDRNDRRLRPLPSRVRRVELDVHQPHDEPTSVRMDTGFVDAWENQLPQG